MRAPAGATLVEAVATAGGAAASPADMSIKNGVTGVTDTLLAADGSRFLRLTSAFSASPSSNDTSDGSNSSSNDSTSSSAFGGPGVAQALCELKPAAPTSNESQQAQQQQSPRQLSLSFFARASLCAEGEGAGEGEAVRLLKVLLLVVPLNASAAAAGGGGAAGGEAGEQVWGEWRVGVPCGASSASLSGALPWFQFRSSGLKRAADAGAAAAVAAAAAAAAAAPAVQAAGAETVSHNAAAEEGVGESRVAAARTVQAASFVAHAAAAAAEGVGTRPGAAEFAVAATDPSPLKSFSHWPLSSAHPLLTAGSTRRNRSSLSLTTLSDLNAAALALHPTPFALLAPATPSSPCRPFSFSTSFTFRISSPNAAGLGGEGLAFVMLPTPTLGLPGPSLGYGRLLLPPGSTTGADDSQLQQQRSLAVEFDTASSPEFWDRPDHHVGVNLHGSMLSLASAPVHPLGIPALNAGQTLLATIHYNASSSLLTWLGGNDPEAAAPPPPLFVGFTAATGKGAEQAQAHEVLGWTFQVGEGELLAEDPLLFWAADSFSFPYITPATPLLTHGSTRKRFFAADLSVAADARSPWDASVLLPSCKCALKLPSFEPTHLTGLPSCFPGETWSAREAYSCQAYTCRQLYSNPCAPGVCIDGVDGSYSCLCPLPYFPFAFSPKGTASCSLVQAGGTRMPTFLSQFGLTCPLILNTFGLTQTQFFSENKGFQCRAPIPADTLVNVTSRAFSKCTAMYTVNYGDTCDSINALFNTQIEPLNPALSCSDGPRHGQLLCVAFDQEWYDQGNTNVKCNHYARITPATPSSSLQQTAPYTVESVLISELESPQTCQGLWQAFSLASPTRFFQLNPGLPCDSLLPDSPLQGNFVTEVCVAGFDSRPLSGVPCSTKRLYSVKRGDTE
ncbi:unnamed protein product [Closterium sp. NIES-64]|nr:unnamed protein product [Closterium sp. NIES-64]